MLKPKGILCMETPNLDSHLYNREKDRYTFLTPPDHQWIFSRKSINEFFGKNSDVRIMRITTYSYSEHFMKIIKSIFFKKMNVAQTDKSRKDNQENLGKKAKYIFFDQTLAPLFVWIINLFNKGTFLQVYIKKL
jgi:polynucleotide 5'-kinase involved in rRNA processing